MTSKRPLPGSGFALLFCLMAVSFAGQSAPTNSTPLVRSAPAAKSHKRRLVQKSAPAPLAPALKSSVHQQGIELPAFSPDELERIKHEDGLENRKRVRIGVPREFAEPIVINSQTAPASSWTVLPDGSRIWTVHIASHGALGLRVHIENLHLNAGAALIVYNPNSAEATAVSVPPEIPGTDPGVWAPTVFGEDVVVECQLPPGADPAEVSFSIPGVSHRYRGLKATPAINSNLCEHDVECYFPQWEDAANGVASIDFIEKGVEFVCTGCLLNDSDPETLANYFLTAHHCVHSRTVAATLEAIWFYQRNGCDDSSTIDDGILIGGGADLLATSSASDFSLLRLREDPPDGVTYEGWTTAGFSSGDNVTTIHHPEGFEKKISFGNELGEDRDFWHVSWNIGVTEGGSSGSPLFNGGQEVTGQLFGGESACDNPTGEDVYGRFDVTYVKIRKWIDNYAFLRVQGAYNGLFSDSGNATTGSSGFFNLVLRDQGSYSGKLQIAGKKYSISGQFDDSGVADNNIVRSGMSSLAVHMTLDITAGAEALTGTVSDGTWTAALLAKRAAFNSKTNPAPFAPKYTLVLPGADSSQAPRGHGFAALTVDANGKAKLSGSLPDGTKITQTVPIAPDRTLPMFANLYSGKGVLDGWLAFDGSTPAADMDGTIAWIKDPIATAKFYPAGFSLSVPAAGELYMPPAMGTSILPFTSGTVSFSGGNLVSDFSNDVTLSTSSKIMNDSANKLSMSFVLSNGLFNGSVTPPSGTRGISFHGIVLESTGAGYGYFLGTSESGSVILQAP